MTAAAKKVILLLLLCVVIAVVPLLLNRDSEFGGSDDLAEELIESLNPKYEAWMDPVMEPPGGETESLLFCLQAAIGGAVLGYGFGVLKERTKRSEQTEAAA